MNKTAKEEKEEGEGAEGEQEKEEEEEERSSKVRRMVVVVNFAATPSAITKFSSLITAKTTM